MAVMASSVYKKWYCCNVLCPAVEKDNFNLVRASLKYQPEIINKSDISHLFQKMASREMVSVFLHHCGDKILEYYGTRKESILVEALRFHKNVEIIEEIISFNKDTVNYTDKEGRTPLYYYVLHGANAELVKCLLLNGSEVNKRCVLGQSPLHHAKTLDIVKILIEAGANIDAKDIRDNTPIMDALMKKTSKDIIFQLIKYGADLNISSDTHRQIPLHQAFFAGYEEDVIYEIFHKTANVNAQDSDGRTPLCFAFENIYAWSNNDPLYRKEFILDLINKGAELNFQVFCSALMHYKNFEIIRAFIDYGFDVRLVSTDGNGFLHYVKHEKMVNLLVRNGASVNIKNNNGETPLIEAIKRYNVEVVKSLLWHGSNPDDGLEFYLKNTFHRLPVDDKIISELILYGANVSLKNKQFKNLFIRVLNFEYAPFEIAQNHKIIRYVFISNKISSFMECLPNNHGISLICIVELCKMKSINIMPNVSVYDFCINHYKSMRYRINASENTLVKDDYQNMKSLFPNFYDEIKTKIEINIKIQNRIKLLNKSFKLSVKASTDSIVGNSNNKPQNAVDAVLPFDYIELNRDILYHIGRYLNDFELNCLMYAAIKD